LLYFCSVNINIETKMKSKIKFLSSKIIILTDKIEIAHYYRDLMYIEYIDKFCRLHFAGGAEYIVNISLAKLYENIPDKPFVRCNRTAVINIFYFHVYDKTVHEITLEDGAKFTLSKRNIAIFKKKLDYMKYVSLPGPDCAGCDEQNCSDFRFFCVAPDIEKNEKIAKN